MERRTGIMIVMLGVSVLLSVPLVRGQQPSGKAAPPAPPTPSRPSTPPTAPHPAKPGVPSIPKVPSLPALPELPDIDPLGDVMFPPDLIMRHARELGLSDEQKSFMRDQIQRTTMRFNELQWQLQDAMEMLYQTLESTSVNEEHALSQLNKVLDVEREIKHLHVGMGIRLKNHLTPEQQAKLHSIRRPPHRAPRG